MAKKTRMNRATVKANVILTSTKDALRLEEIHEVELQLNDLGMVVLPDGTKISVRFHFKGVEYA
jgi:hypothetical protein